MVVSQLEPKMRKKMSVNDYQLLVVVGKGSFGKVSASALVVLVSLHVQRD